MRKYFPIRRGLLARTVASIRAVDGIDLDLAPGEALGLVGESGCGKSTTGRCLLRLIQPDAGSVRFQGTELLDLAPGPLRRMRRHLQMVFQDPYASLNPRLRIREVLVEPMLVHGLCQPGEADERAVGLLRRVGLAPEHLERWPHEFSGGQRQRLGIARALAVEPRLIVCDEAVSALDVSVQAQVINLLADLQAELGMAYLFIAHDLAVVAHLCSRVAVMYLGEIVEEGPVATVLGQALHPYTRTLLAAVPAQHPRDRRCQPPPVGEPPSPSEPPSAERVARRFPAWRPAFEGGPLMLHEAGPGHRVRCARLDVLRALGERIPV